MLQMQDILLKHVSEKAVILSEIKWMRPLTYVHIDISVLKFVGKIAYSDDHRAVHLVFVALCRRQQLVT